MLEISQIVPALAPAVNGLGDYAVVLASELQRFGIDSRFVVAGMPPRDGMRWEVDSCAVQTVRKPEPGILVRALEQQGAETVLLHFSGYGYASRGLCFWLTEGLAGWKMRGSRRQLITMFHELYAMGPPWRMDFWTSWPQRRIARELAGLSHEIFCSSELTGCRLSNWYPGRRITILPVFSNVGELPAPMKWPEREPFAVVFGGIPQRSSFYRNASEDLFRSLKGLGIAKIIDVGPKNNLPNDIFGLPLETRGAKQPSEVSAILARARIGLVDYPLNQLGKSGILAAYHAHGLLVVNINGGGPASDGMTTNKHFANPLAFPLGECQIETIIESGNCWYKKHDRVQAGCLFARALYGNR